MFQNLTTYFLRCLPIVITTSQEQYSKALPEQFEVITQKEYTYYTGVSKDQDVPHIFSYYHYHLL